ncbi:P2Y purinoceptor 2-like [Boleophthalmus pectinirostris]|uniref:P2Y purinoceptor 2-like n=1 Tax=Boleophthalmus pectinirostris TaxID=150288 RepID=UPI00242CDA82|nr:P2Y purinoceptor 2-like [Boleophthalmus pectinirostris]
MNNSSDSGICLSTPQHMSIPVLMCLVYFMGFLLNVFSLWVFCCRMSSWSAGTILQFCLALSDALGAPVTPLIAVYFAMGNKWLFGKVLCTVTIVFVSSQFYGSTIFLTLISFHRYKAVVHFNKSSRMKDKSFIKKLCAGVWLFLITHSLVYGFGVPATKEGEVTHCLSFSQVSLTNSFFIISCVLVSIGFLLPLSISATCYFRVKNALTCLNITAKSLKVKLKSQRMIQMCLIIFTICFLPANIIGITATVMMKFYPEHCHTLHQLQTAYYASWIIAGLNCFLDPLLYCFGSQNFRDAFPSFHIKSTEPQQSDTEMTPNAEKITAV